MSASRTAILLALTISTLSSANKLKEPDGLLDESEKSDRGAQLSVHAYLPYHSFWGFFPLGAGANFYIPLVQNGFIGKLNDSFGLDFGGDIVIRFGSTYPVSLHIPAAVVWKFHMLPQLEVYAKLGLQADIWFGVPLRAFGYFSPVWPIAAVGANYMFSPAFGVKAEFGTAGLRAGVVFDFAPAKEAPKDESKDSPKEDRSPDSADASSKP